MERRLAAVLAADMFGYSRLMEADVDGVIARQKSHRRELIDPEIERNRGHIVKTTGDGMLAEFASAYDALRCAIEIQTAMPAREQGQSDDRRIQYRIGINVGDVVFDEGDIFGDGVNVAARLESLAEPGSVCVSDPVYQLVQDRLAEPMRDLGSQKIKNISRPIRVWQWSPKAPAEPEKVAEIGLSQRVQFCRAPDGVELAFASVGQGPPVFKAPNWLNHIEYEWQSPVWRPLLEEFAKKYQFVRFDQRGNGLSDWDVENITQDVMVADMATVADAAGLEGFALFGMSQGCGLSIRYAVEHPERVRCMILHGGYTRGALTRDSAEEKQLHEAAMTMIKRGWGSPNPTYRHFFTSAFIPDATLTQANSFDELQRVSTNPENAARIAEMNARIDITEVARKVAVPTLVMHCEGDRRIPFAEGRRMAGLIPGARFVTLSGDNHIPLEGTPAFDAFFEEIHAFMREHFD